MDAHADVNPDIPPPKIATPRPRPAPVGGMARAAGPVDRFEDQLVQTVQHVLQGSAGWWSPAEPEEQAIVDLLDGRGVLYTNLDGWHRLDAHEQQLGEPHGRARIKVVPRDEMVRISRD